MKSSIALLQSAILFLFITTVTYPQSVQWNPVFASYVSAGLNGIVQIGDSTLVAVGEYATIVRSTDLGKNRNNFTRKPLLNGASNLNGIAVSGSGSCIAVGNNGIIARSSDMGLTWETNHYGTTTFRRVRFWRETGIIVGDSGVILQSTNSGVSWTKVESGTKQNLHDIHFSTANIISIVGNNGTLLRSRDEGNTWKRDTALSANNLTSICGDGSKLVISGDKAEIYRSSDAGASWKKVENNALPRRSRSMAMKGDTVIGIGSINEITEGQYFSFDAGLTWKQVQGSMYLYDQYIGLTENKEFLICGRDSHISLLRNGDVIADTSGSNFTGLGVLLLYSVEKSVISEVRSKSANSFSMILNGKIATTSDNGQSYDTVTFLPHVFTPANLFTEVKQLFINNDNDFVVRAEGKLGNKFMTTISSKAISDTVWSHNAIGDSVPYYAHLDVNEKYCTVRDGFALNQIYLSSDGGKTWSKKIIPGDIMNSSVTESGAVWLIYWENNRYILAKTWIERDSLINYSSTTTYRTVYARDDAVYTFSSVPNSGYYDETMMYSSDSGATWKTIFSQHTSLGSATIASAIGKSIGSKLIAHSTKAAELRYTTDNGNRWETIPLPHTSSQTWIDCANDSTLLVSTQVTVWAASLSHVITSVSEPTSYGNKIAIFPNPAAGHFTVSCPENAAVTVSDVFGRSVYAGEGGVVSTSGWAAGVYFVEAAAGGVRSVGMVAVGR